MEFLPEEFCPFGAGKEWLHGGHRGSHTRSRLWRTVAGRQNLLLGSLSVRHEEVHDSRFAVAGRHNQEARVQLVHDARVRSHAKANPHADRQRVSVAYTARWYQRAGSSASLERLESKWSLCRAL